MVPQLGPELQYALHATENDLEVVDPSTNRHYVIVSRERWMGQTAADQAVERDDGTNSHDAKSVDWTDEKNQRRAELVDRQIAGTLTSGEQAELERLQHEMRAYRDKVAPLPLEDTRRLHAQLMEQARQAELGKA